MNLGTFIEMERQEAVERAMANYRANQGVRERRRTGLWRTISREEALNTIAKKNPRAALKLLHGYGIGVRTPAPELRSQ